MGTVAIVADGGNPEYVGSNRAAWATKAAGIAEAGRRNWSSEPCWGMWSIPESEVELRPPEGATTPFPYVALDWSRQ